MKIERVARRIYLTLLLSLAPAGIASAQCLEFAPGFGPQGGGLSNGPLAQVAFDDGNGPALYVGGDFTLAGNLPIRNIAKWDGTSWSALGDGLDGPVWAMAVFDDGTGPALYVGGHFFPTGPTGIGSVAKWDGSDWSNVGQSLVGIQCMTVYDDGSGPALYVGGGSHVYRLNGSSWSEVGTGLTNTEVW